MWKKSRPILADWTARIIFSFASGTVIEVLIAGLTLRQSLIGRIVVMPLIIGLATPYRLYRAYFLKKFKVVSAKGLRQIARKFAVETVCYSTFYLGLYMIQLACVGATWRQILTACATLTVSIAPLGIPFGWWQDFVTHRIFKIPRDADGATGNQSAHQITAKPPQGKE